MPFHWQRQPRGEHEKLAYLHQVQVNTLKSFGEGLPIDRESWAIPYKDNPLWRCELREMGFNPEKFFEAFDYRMVLLVASVPEVRKLFPEYAERQP